MKHYCPDCVMEGYPCDKTTQLKSVNPSRSAQRSLSYTTQVDDLLRCPMCREYFVLRNGELAAAADWVIP